MPVSRALERIVDGVCGQWRERGAGGGQPLSGLAGEGGRLILVDGHHGAHHLSRTPEQAPARLISTTDNSCPKTLKNSLSVAADASVSYSRADRGQGEGGGGGQPLSGLAGEGEGGGLILVDGHHGAHHLSRTPEQAPARLISTTDNSCPKTLKNSLSVAADASVSYSRADRGQGEGGEGGGRPTAIGACWRRGGVDFDRRPPRCTPPVSYTRAGSGPIGLDRQQPMADDCEKLPWRERGAGGGQPLSGLAGEGGRLILVDGHHGAHHLSRTPEQAPARLISTTDNSWPKTLKDLSVCRGGRLCLVLSSGSWTGSVGSGGRGGGGGQPLSGLAGEGGGVDFDRRPPRCTPPVSYTRAGSGPIGLDRQQPMADNCEKLPVRRGGRLCLVLLIRLWTGDRIDVNCIFVQYTDACMPGVFGITSPNAHIWQLCDYTWFSYERVFCML
ncbi:hypothetical protein BDV93DRAFT_513674 [Ceratobasidium sp. AG-I]|nr:hypothetical protein BDV93DRAFT_513674 [Ceratobasidium sp. AG-I]